MRALLVLFAVLPLAGCNGLDPDEVDVPAGLAVPDEAYQTAYAFAANRVGPLYFDRLYEVNRSSTGPAYLVDCDPATCAPLARLPHWYVHFDLVVDGRDWGDGATVRVWPNGTIANFEEEYAYSGLPECKRRPASCWFWVDEQQAREVAERDGLRPRGCPLHVLAGWSAQFERFTWQVSDPSCPARSEDGQDVQVDVATGRVIDRSGWSLTID
jgi:hypothetical protein